jgi:hypothetical protein
LRKKLAPAFARREVWRAFAQKTGFPFFARRARPSGVQSGSPDGLEFSSSRRDTKNR